MLMILYRMNLEGIEWSIHQASFQLYCKQIFLLDNMATILELTTQKLERKLSSAEYDGQILLVHHACELGVIYW